MASLFPGMDPYLEGANIWEDFHACLATEMRRQLSPQLRPRYVAVLTPKVSYEEITIQTGTEKRFMKPDVLIFQRGGSVPQAAEAVAIAPAPFVGEASFELPVKSQRIEIRETGDETLITAIEILSPVNKQRGHHTYEGYLRKRQRLLRTEVHLLEIDLLRAGVRPPLLTPLPEEAHYFIFLNRSGDRSRVEIWPLRMQEPIPLLPVPLRDPDPDVPLDLQQAIHTVYDDAAYDLRIDYRQPPPKPALTPEDADWLETHLQAFRV